MPKITIAIAGPQGVGKTTLALAISKLLRCYDVEVSLSHDEYDPVDVLGPAETARLVAKIIRDTKTKVRIITTQRNRF